MAYATTTQHQQKTKKLPRKVFLIGAVILLTAITVLLVWFRPSGLLQVSDKAFVKQEIANALQGPFSGALLYESIDDIGCRQTDIGVGKAYYCNYEGRKYFKSQENPDATMGQIRTTLTTQGWHSDETSSTRYFKTADDPVIHVTQLSAEDLQNEELAKALPAEVKNALAANQHIDEILATHTYWSCSMDSFFKQPCPNPSGEVH